MISIGQRHRTHQASPIPLQKAFRNVANVISAARLGPDAVGLNPLDERFNTGTFLICCIETIHPLLEDLPRRMCQAVKHNSTGLGYLTQDQIGRLKSTTQPRY